MIQKCVEYTTELYGLYFGNGSYLLLVVAALFVWMIKCRAKQGSRIVWASGILAVLFLNPVTIYVFHNITNAGRYVRTFWAIPFIMGIAYIAVKILEEKRSWQKVLLIVAIAMLMNMTGETILNSTNFAEADNLYKMPADVMEVADVIEEHCQPGESPYVLANVYLSIYLRQYDGNIRLVYGRNTFHSEDKETRQLFGKIYDYADTEIPYDELYWIGERALWRGVDTIVFAKWQVQSNALETLGYTRVDETESYYIFKLQ